MVTHERYPVEACRKLETTSLESILKVLRGEQKVLAVEGEAVAEGHEAVTTTESKKEDNKGKKEGDEAGGKGKKGAKGEGKRGEAKRAKGEKGEIGGEDCGKPLKILLGYVLGYGPALLEHIILDAGLKPGIKVWADKDSDSGVMGLKEGEIESLIDAVWRFEKWLGQVARGELSLEGFITIQKKGNKESNHLVSNGVSPNGEKQEGDVKMFDEFTPIILCQYRGRENLVYPTFDAAMDDFFSKIEGQKATQHRAAAENQAMAKLEKIRADQTKRAEQLAQEVDVSVEKGALIEYNLGDVDAAIRAVCAALANGMNWADLQRMVKEEKKAGNPVAGLIHSMQLEKNQITLLLANNLDEMDDEQRTTPVMKVEVDLSLTAYGNARMWFDAKKKHEAKREKTVAAHKQAFAAAAKKSQQQLAQAKVVASISHLRKVHWFEKFNWFVTSENYLVISGRDAQQNELVVKRYLGKGDLYIHADLHGASSTVIKNHNPTVAIPPLSINQSGAFTVCRSAAWDSKIVTSAWWVHPNQVSKTAPTGEYLTVGSFMIRGKKNFLPPNQLVMGFAMMFRVDDSCLGAHLNERKVRGEAEEGEGEVEGGSATRERETMRDGEGNEDEDEEGGGEEEAKVKFGESEENEEAGKRDTEQDEGGSVEDSKREEKVVGEIDEGSRDRERETKEGEDIERGGVPVSNEIEESDEDGVKAELDELLDEAFSGKGWLPRGRDKYGLERADGEVEVGSGKVGAEIATVNPQVSTRNRPYVSKVERRRSKKGGEVREDGEAEKGVGDGSRDTLAGNIPREESLRCSKDRGIEREAVEGMPGISEGHGELDIELEDSDVRGRGGRGKGLVVEGGEGLKEEEERGGRKKNASGKEGERDEGESGKMDGEGMRVGRGKRGKMKKVKEKYRDQDEEERRVTMALLGSEGRQDASKNLGQSTVPGPKKGGKGVGTIQEKAKDSEKPLPICYKCQQEGHVARECPTLVKVPAENDNLESKNLTSKSQSQQDNKSIRLEQEIPRGGDMGFDIKKKEDRKDQDVLDKIEEPGRDEKEVKEGLSRRAQRKLDEAEIGRLLEEENVQEVGAEAKGQLTEQDMLTGIPKPNDVLLYAVPVCAPYSALQGYKYRVKLTPGSGKKGKAAKTALEVFVRLPEASARERELMKAATEPELVAAMLGNVKVTAPGLTKIKQSQKKGKKQAASSNKE